MHREQRNRLVYPQSQALWIKLSSSVKTVNESAREGDRVLYKILSEKNHSLESQYSNFKTHIPDLLDHQNHSLIVKVKIPRSGIIRAQTQVLELRTVLLRSTPLSPKLQNRTTPLIHIHRFMIRTDLLPPHLLRPRINTTRRQLIPRPRHKMAKPDFWLKTCLQRVTFVRRIA